MGLRDIFGPKWRHSNPDVRLRALEAGVDEVALAKLALADPSEQVRRVAMEKTEDPDVLASVAAKECKPDIRSRAAKRLLEMSAEQAASAVAQVTGHDALVCSAFFARKGYDHFLRTLASAGYRKESTDRKLAQTGEAYQSNAVYEMHWAVGGKRLKFGYLDEEDGGKTLWRLFGTDGEYFDVPGVREGRTLRPMSDYYSDFS